MLQASQAIAAALSSDWKRAIEVNQSILKEDPKNINALNRLGFAYLNLREIKKAKEALEKVLKLDPFNPIATKNLRKLKDIEPKLQNNCQTISPSVFLEEPGITKLVNLVNLAPKSILSSIQSGQKVVIIPKKNRIEVRTENNLYLGVFPDDLSFRLRKLIKMGNKYCAFIKAVDKSLLTIIIRETERGKKVKDASFSVKLTSNYHSSIRSELLEELLEEESEATSSEEGVKEE